MEHLAFGPKYAKTIAYECDTIKSIMHTKGASHPGAALLAFMPHFKGTRPQVSTVRRPGDEVPPLDTRPLHVAS
jgi:hypothetical protein